MDAVLERYVTDVSAAWAVLTDRAPVPRTAARATAPAIVIRRALLMVLGSSSR
jgi:hypothetical protein